MCGIKARDVISGLDVHIPPVDILIAGIDCGGASGLNIYRQGNQTMIKDGTASTGRAFAVLLQFIIKHRPKLLIVENVPNTESLHIDDEGAQSWLWPWLDISKFAPEVSVRRRNSHGRPRVSIS